VLMDQRGCGKSTPTGELRGNTTWHLVADIERLREALGVRAWALVFGGSWGSTLALAYAQRHPDRVRTMVLRGIFTLRKAELDFFYQLCGGARMLFPDAWEHFVAPIPPAERGDMLAAYRARLTSEDAATRLAAATAWSVWEGVCAQLYNDARYAAHFADPAFSLPFARIENHFFVHGGWMTDGQLLLKANVDKIRHIPTVIVQGRYDIICPTATAWALHRAWPEACWRLVPDAGHSAFEPGIQRELLAATDALRPPPHGDAPAPPPPPG